MAAPEVIRDLEFCQLKEIICARDKDVEETLQLAKDELEVQYIWEIFLWT